MITESMYLMGCGIGKLVRKLVEEEDNEKKRASWLYMSSFLYSATRRERLMLKDRQGSSDRSSDRYLNPWIEYPDR